MLSLAFYILYSIWSFLLLIHYFFIPLSHFYFDLADFEPALFYSGFELLGVIFMSLFFDYKASLFVEVFFYYLRYEWVASFSWFQFFLFLKMTMMRFNIHILQNSCLLKIIHNVIRVPHLMSHHLLLYLMQWPKTFLQEVSCFLFPFSCCFFHASLLLVTLLLLFSFSLFFVYCYLLQSK